MSSVGTRVSALFSSRGTLQCMQRVNVTVIPQGPGSLGETVTGVQEPFGVFSGCAGDWARVWLGAVWMEALHPPGQIQEDGLDQLSIGFGILS